MTEVAFKTNLIPERGGGLDRSHLHQDLVGDQGGLKMGDLFLVNPYRYIMHAFIQR